MTLKILHIFNFVSWNTLFFFYVFLLFFLLFFCLFVCKRTRCLFMTIMNNVKRRRKDKHFKNILMKKLQKIQYGCIMRRKRRKRTTTATTATAATTTTTATATTTTTTTVRGFWGIRCRCVDD